MPTIDLNRKQVFPFFQITGHIKFRRGLRGFTHPHFLSVDIYLRITADGTEMKHYFSVFPAGRDSKCLTIGSYRIIHIDIWGIRRKDILNITDNRFTKSLQFPIGRYCNISPTLVLQFLMIKIVITFLYSWRIGEFPLSIQ